MVDFKEKRSLCSESKITLIADDNTRALIKEVLNEIMNSKLKEMMAMILKAVGKQPWNGILELALSQPHTMLISQHA